MIISCKKASELIEKKSTGCISRIERFRLNVHLLRCKMCQAYEKQSKLLEKGIHKIFSKAEKKALSQSIKNQWIENLRK